MRGVENPEVRRGKKTHDGEGGCVVAYRYFALLDRNVVRLGQKEHFAMKIHNIPRVHLS